MKGRLRLCILLEGNGACMCVCSLAQSFATPCNPMYCGPPGSSIHGVSQARMLERLPFLSPGGLSDPGMEPMNLASPALAGRFHTTSATWEA